MSECQHCSQTPEQHINSAGENLADMLIMNKLAEIHPEMKETIEKIVLGWRSHALPECDPLAIS